MGLVYARLRRGIEGGPALRAPHSITKGVLRTPLVTH